MSGDVPPPAIPSPAATPPDAPPKIRVSFFVVMILAAILLYVISAGPAAYVGVVAYRTFGGASWVTKAFYTIYRPHLDLCYRRQGYYEYIRWFIVQAGGDAKSHAQFKEFWEVEAGYRSAPTPPS